MQDFKNLKVWKESYDFAIEMYKITSKFPLNEQYGLTQQLRRASTSISANIAEGTGRGSNPDFLRFLYNALGSVKECENFLMMSKDLGYLSTSEFGELNSRSEKIGKMLNSLIKSIKN